MIPSEPPRQPQLGFLYIHPFRIQGISVAGEESFVMAPELNLCFDLGRAAKPMLACDHVALTHGHMDHTAGIAYYFSQRHFQDMPSGTVYCPMSLEKPLLNLMAAWINVENQRTAHRIVGLEPEQMVEIKNHHFLRAFSTIHTVPSLGYVVIEKRSKLREEYVGLPQEKLVELKSSGTEITRILEIPLVCYTGDTSWGPHFERPDVLNAKILITECTFIESDHRDRAGVGKHLHLDHIVQLLEASNAEAVILTHLSRRTHIGAARKAVFDAVPARHRDRLFILMDGRTNKARYEQQKLQAEAEMQGNAQ